MMKQVVLSQTLNTIRVFIDNELDDTEGWYSYLWAVAKMLDIAPMDLRDMAIEYRGRDEQALAALGKELSNVD